METRQAWTLFHVGFDEIRQPDPHRGRSNADFGPGFYLSADRDFSLRWARERRGADTILNAYELSAEGLRVKRLSRDAEWYDAIFRSRAGYPDALAGWDVVVGPIANDTLYDTWGILTSGLLPPEQALALLRIGPEYTQTVVKTERAAARLRWLSAEKLEPARIALGRQAVAREEAEYQRLLAEALERMDGEG